MFESGEIGTPNSDRVTAGSNSEDGEVNRGGLGMDGGGEVVLAWSGDLVAGLDFALSLALTLPLPISKNLFANSTTTSDGTHRSHLSILHIVLSASHSCFISHLHGPELEGCLGKSMASSQISILYGRWYHPLSVRNFEAMTSEVTNVRMGSESWGVPVSDPTLRQVENVGSVDGMVRFLLPVTWRRRCMRRRAYATVRFETVARWKRWDMKWIRGFWKGSSDWGGFKTCPLAISKLLVWGEGSGTILSLMAKNEKT
jgi:hypothetical protein